MPHSNQISHIANWILSGAFVGGAIAGQFLPLSLPLKSLIIIAAAFGLGIISYRIKIGQALSPSPKSKIDKEDEASNPHKALAESEERFRNIFEKSSDGIGLIDSKGNIADVNPQFLKMFGYQRRELIGQSVLKLHPESEYESIRNTLGALDGKEQIVAEFLCQKKDGSLFHAQTSGSRVEIGGQIFLQGILRDTTKRRIIEDALRAAKEKAEQNDKLKSAFLANVSHEIRTPLNGIMGFAQLLRDTNTTFEERTRFVDIINSNGDHLLELVNDLIDIAQIDSNQLKLNPSPFSLHSLMKDALATFETQIQQKKNGKVALKIDPPSYPKLIIDGDGTRLRQVLYNLLSNALKFTEKGEIRFGFTRLDDNTLEFVIADTGIGISEEHQTNIFDRFVQVDPHLTRNFEGAGLGLAISKGIIELFGGEIQLESVPQSGTTFRFSVKVNIAEEAHFLAKPIDPAIPQTTLGNKIPILIAEDIDANYELLLQILLPLNFELIRARDGAEAIKIVQERSDLQLILMDQRMPVLDGLTATRRIKEINPRIPILLQTAHARKSDQQNAFGAGCDDFITKPITAAALVRKTEDILSRRTLEGSLTQEKLPPNT